MTLVRSTSKWLRRCESVGVPSYLSCVKTQCRPTFKGRKLMGVTAARAKTEKSKRRPGKSAHVAVDVKRTGTAVHAATIRSKEVASCYSRPKCMSSTPAVQFAPLPSPTFPASATRRGEGRGADSTVKYWVNLNQRDRAVDGATMSGSNVGLSSFAWPVRVWDKAEAENCITWRKNVGKSVTGNWKLKPVTGNFTGNR